jgi:hypothetical protein
MASGFHSAVGRSQTPTLCSNFTGITHPTRQTNKKQAVSGPPVSGPTARGPTVSGPTVGGPTFSGPAASCPTASGSTVSGPTASGPTGSGPTTSSPTASGPTASGPICQFATGCDSCVERSRATSAYNTRVVQQWGHQKNSDLNKYLKKT